MSDFRCSLNRLSGRTPANEEEMHGMRRRAWQEQGVLSVSLSNSQLNWPEKEFLKQIGERLYGYRREE